MRFRPIPLVCECGHKPPSFKNVGITSEYELVIHWICPSCNKRVYAVKSLADCCRDCQQIEESAQPVATAPGDQKEFRLEDKRFLRALGIRWTEDAAV
jgi:hypothetical protein